ncbi:MAG: amidohydrolase family protein [Candidatus Cloacimonetes bacterium]|nr:amidohydrolase family protein [Candidatus Cloacimonadota bacterium]
MKNIRTNIFNPVSPDQVDYLPDHVISIENGKITKICSFSDFHGSWEDQRSCICLPGFIDLHVHLSQYRIRGLYHPALLPWLDSSVFPEEQKSLSEAYATALSRDFFSALIKAGTTFSVIYTAPFREAAEAAFEVAHDMGAKAKIGMTMMDRNAPQGLLQTTGYAISNSIRLHEKWNSESLSYIFTPRFAPTCSAELMREVADYAKSHDAFIQTHLSENPDEIAWVKEIFGKSSYTEVYESLGILGPRSILGHAIHLSDPEMDVLSSSGSSIAHCPDSNFYLKSGEFPLSRVKAHNIPFGLGSDVGAGTSLNMLYHAKQMNFRQNTDPVLPSEMLYRISLANAKILHLDHRMGSLDIGKDADILFFRIPDGLYLGEHSLSQLCFSSEDFLLAKVLVDGVNRLGS